MPLATRRLVKTQRSSATNTAGISIVAFIVAVGVSLAYYQFFYIPEENRRPVIPQEILEPEETIEVSIAAGSSNEGNDQFYVPPSTRATLSISNRVVWTNEDAVPHTVTSDTDYEDPYSGVFDSQARPQEEGGPFVMPSQTCEFLFTQLGTYEYHCVPHPWMQGKIEVVESFA
ncbi:MAG: plastocyanin/azurin family copper-binding protein [Thermoproteota archaeon]